MVLSPQFLKKKKLEIQKNLIPLHYVEVTIIINTLKLLLLCKDLLFQLKTETLVVMFFRLMLLILSMVLDAIVNVFVHWVLSLLWTRLKRKMILLNLKIKVIMKSNNIWKIVIGAVSAALGYILNAIGL
nr:MAG TPA: hypothetical protein [Microviridae sp.]